MGQIFTFFCVCRHWLLTAWNWITWCSLPRTSHNNLLEFLLIVPQVFGPSIYKFSMGSRSGLCDDHSSTFTLLSLSNFVTTLEECLRSILCLCSHKIFIFAYNCCGNFSFLGIAFSHSIRSKMSLAVNDLALKYGHRCTPNYDNSF